MFFQLLSYLTISRPRLGDYKLIFNETQSGDEYYDIGVNIMILSRFVFIYTLY